MARVTVKLNGRTYLLKCADGEEKRLYDLMDHIKGKLDKLIEQFGQVGSERLLLMAAILISDELLDARERADIESST